MMINISPRILPDALLFLSLVVLITACQPAGTTSVPVEREATGIRDTVFWQEYQETYPVGEDPTANQVRSIVIDHRNQVWIATAAGVFRKNPDAGDWIAALPEADQGPSFAVEVDGDVVWISTWNAVYRFKDGEMEKLTAAKAPISTLVVAEEGVYALGPHGVWLFSDTGVTEIKYPIARSVRDAISDLKGGLWVASDVGLYHCSEGQTKHFVGSAELVSAYIRGVAIREGAVWAAGLGGVTKIKDDTKVGSLLPTDGIPSVNVNCIKSSPEGVMWVGTEVGVVRYAADDSHSLLFSRRWLLNDVVNDIAFDGAGNAWIATMGGVSAIKRKPMTLQTKQHYFYDVLMRRHIRDPWIAGQCRLPVAGDTTNWEPEDDDNDGEYTGNYLAMESFRYAATQSDDARSKARKAFRFLKLLQEVTRTDGYFARTIVPVSWHNVHDVNRTYTERQLADELVKEPRFKPVTVRWRKSDDGKWMWKGDTSSDEICGHMFGYFMYYELAADEEDKEVVRRQVARIVDHLMTNDFTLTELDGGPTRWGIWSPDKLNRDPEWSPDRSLNSMELLSFLKLAYYMTGDQKYQQTYLRLIEKEGYMDNMDNIPNQNPAWFIYYDVILAAYQYPILLKCEQDPKLLAFYQAHIDQWMAMRKGDQNPLINFIYSYARSKPVEIEASVAFLQNTPLDLVDWTIDHSLREDIHLSREPVLGEIQVSELQPAAIRATVRWDKNPWGLTPGNPHVEREPVFWLLPYWMGRYMDMIR